MHRVNMYVFREEKKEKKVRWIHEIAMARLITRLRCDVDVEVVEFQCTECRHLDYCVLPRQLLIVADRHCLDSEREEPGKYRVKVSSVTSTYIVTATYQRCGEVEGSRCDPCSSQS
ncbi:hypothetical protein F2P81_002355 [Scophthalmus maximus]|uniref:Uncharacterized protein n=1 Tax=Scophthalmus maximus TaxID=52904 RepID=A0A6A4TE10_SCOMX|nr:hypothetical protein F2P81_002355 [Scophthalmus maximus]